MHSVYWMLHVPHERELVRSSRQKQVCLHRIGSLVSGTNSLVGVHHSSEAHSERPVDDGQHRSASSPATVHKENFGEEKAHNGSFSEGGEYDCVALESKAAKRTPSLAIDR